MITRVSSGGQVNTINKKALASTYNQYERKFPNPYVENNLEYIQAIENKFLSFESIPFSLNGGDGTYQNQLNVVQYEIKVDEEFNYTVFDYS
ncbi:hypothetical protein J4G37_58950, partial [Microvirga sp. 3-52]|nr:hypothetical protein [Microvirga sp. 3-52]